MTLTEQATEMTNHPSRVCDQCQSHQAIVTIGCVDYCARCAPSWKEDEE